MAKDRTWPPPPEATGREALDLVRFAWQHERPLIVTNAAVASVAVGCVLTSAYGFGATLQALSVPGAPDLASALGVYAAAAAAGSIAEGAHSALCGTIAERVVLALRTSAASHYTTDLPVAQVEALDSAALMSSLSTDAIIARDGLAAGLSLPRNILHTVLGAAYMISLSPPLFATALAAFPVIGAIGFGVSSAIAKAQLSFSAEQASALGFFKQTLSCLRTVRIYGRSVYAQDEYRRRAGLACGHGVQIALLSGGAEVAWRLAIAAMLSALFWRSATLDIELGVASAFLVVALDASGAAGGSMAAATTLKRAGIAARALLRTAGQPTSAPPPSETPWDDVGVTASTEPTTAPTGARLPAVSFERVQFSYPGRPEVRVLNELSFAIHPGETVALLGPSGCGKSTVAALVSGWFAPDRGTVSLFGRPASDFAAAGHPRGLLALVPQTPSLLEGSLADNIAYGMPRADKATLILAASRAHAEGFIRALPEGFATAVAHDQQKLSGGQVQRIALARALLPQPRILILDEPTSALDVASQHEVQRALLDMRRAQRAQGDGRAQTATLLITHSEELAHLLADRVVRLQVHAGRASSSV